jgi:hypothetical protein
MAASQSMAAVPVPVWMNRVKSWRVSQVPWGDDQPGGRIQHVDALGSGPERGRE